MTVDVRLTAPDGTVLSVAHVSSTVDREFGKMDMARLRVPRGDLNDIQVEEGRTEVELVDGDSAAFGGVLRDVVREGATAELVVDSYERYALDAEPTGPTAVFEDTSDDLIIRNAISRVGEVARDRVAQLQSGLSFTFTHASAAKQLRDVERVTSGELRYTPEKTVEYVDRLGRDKTHVTLSPDSRKLAGGLTVERVGDTRRVTHLRVLGAGEGQHQLSTEVVADSYTQDEREKWAVEVNKDVDAQDTLAALGETLIAELDEPYVEVSTTIVNEAVALGDSFHVVHPDEQIDRTLRVVRLRTVRDKNGVRYGCTLSSRVKSRESAEEKHSKDIERYNRSVQGGAVPINAGGGRSSVDDGHRYRMKLYYPSDVVSELRLNVRVSGLAYRDTAGGSISESGSYPADCDVLVNGESVGVSLGDGSGSFQEVVDITGWLEEGTFNTVDVTSESLGDMRAWVEGDVYRQILGSG
jgi:hypothetical protein